jgi:predicted enzyme related to lactoylglutathione lyase
MRNTIYWVEIPASNLDRAKKFYETILNVEMIPVSMPRGKYFKFPLDPNALGAGGAIIEGEGYNPSETGRIVYLDRSEDLDITLARIEAGGGKIIHPKIKNGANGEFGFIALFIDPEGNKMGLHSSI